MSESPHKRLASLARAHGTEALLVVLVAALTLFVRWTRLEPIENGGDPLDNWYFVRQWAYESDPAHTRLDHHASRFGIHAITWVAQTLLGTHPRVYYVPQLFASTVSTVLTYVLGRQVSGRFVGLASALLLLECEPLVSASSQLRPGIFEMMYALAATVCLVRFIGAAGRSARAWLSASAVLVFLAYLSHEPDAFLVPGMMLVVWLKRRDYRDLLVFAGVLGGLLFAETASYALFTRYSSRVAVLSGSHLKGLGPEGRSFEFLFERFTKAGAAVKAAYYPFFIAGPVLVVLARNLREKAVAIVAASFLFLVTFFVKSFDPLVVFMAHRDRYVFATIPFAYIATLHCLVVIGRRLVERIRARGVSIPLRIPRFVGSGIAWICAVTSMGVVGLRASESARRPHPFRTIDATYETLNDTYRRNLPIIGRVTGRARFTQVRALHWAHKGFLKDEFFLKDGVLQSFRYGRDLAVLNPEESYFPKRVDAARARELDKSGCALRLQIRGMFVELSSRGRLPKRCRP